MPQLAEPARHFLIPEVVQTSAMDCGPAALKSVLEGFGISVSYGRLREACQTDVDGTSIDTLEEVANQLGLDAMQMLVPIDHLLMDKSQSLPALVGVQQPNGLTHFAVIWSQHGPLVQVMDPGTGRRWPTRRSFLPEVFLFTYPFAPDEWREWASSAGFCNPLRLRLQNVAHKHPELEPAVERLLEKALADEGWFSLACLDAATRMTEDMITAEGLERGGQGYTILEDLFTQACQEQPEQYNTIPSFYWIVRPSNDGTRLLMQGALLIQFFGRREESAPAVLAEVAVPAEAGDGAGEAVPVEPGEAAQEPAEPGDTVQEPLSPELVAALNEPPPQPAREILQMVRADSVLSVALVVLALVVGAASLIFQELILRGITDPFWRGESADLRKLAVAAIGTLVVAYFFLERFTDRVVLRIARNLETRFRLRFLAKIPSLNDRYFQSRLISDMIHRIYNLRQIRLLPVMLSASLSFAGQLLFTLIGLIWLHVSGAPLAVLAVSSIVGTVLLVQPLLEDYDMRLRTHLGGLSRFYLDTLLGIIPIRTHGAEEAVRREHEGLVARWIQASNDFLHAYLLAFAAELLVSTGFAVVMVLNYLQSGGSRSGVLLYLFWVLTLPRIGRELIRLMLQYPMQRNLVLRLLEPIMAPEEPETIQRDQPDPQGAQSTAMGITITFDDVTVRASGHTILSDLNLELRAGEHLAIVGPSGAGKSSLVGILLGWHRPASGQVLVDGLPLDSERLHRLRRETVWVDPAVQLWNQSLLENLRYGNDTADETVNGLPLDEADLGPLLKRLPNSLQTVLGEGGGLVSGGEGQRVRLGRAIMRSRVRLVILDEPFRGLDRARRRDLLARAREHWSDATLIFISHDIDESQHFGRTLVIEDGRIVEDGDPTMLAAQPDSRYHQLLKADQRVREGMWSDATWKRLWLSEGRLTHRPHQNDSPAQSPELTNNE